MSVLLRTCRGSLCLATAISLAFAYLPKSTAYPTLNYGERCLIAHDFSKAETYFRAEIAAKNDDVQAHYNLSKALYLQHRFTETVQELKTVIRLDATGSIGNQARLALAKLQFGTQVNSSNTQRSPKPSTSPRATGTREPITQPPQMPKISRIHRRHSIIRFAYLTKSSSHPSPRLICPKPPSMR